MSEQQIESEIKARGADVAPRITPEMIDACIAHEFFLHGSEAAMVFASDVPRVGPLPIEAKSLECLTICVLTLRNGFTIVGKSACASPENYNEEIGRNIARADARQQIWALEGYRLRSQLSEPSIFEIAAAARAAGPEEKY